jgi:hypothetical protein
MTVALSQQTLKKLIEGFGLNSAAYNALIASAEKSDFFASELNAFGGLVGWSFVKGQSGTGGLTNLTGKFIGLSDGTSSSYETRYTLLNLAPVYQVDGFSYESPKPIGSGLFCSRLSIKFSDAICIREVDVVSHFLRRE